MSDQPYNQPFTPPPPPSTGNPMYSPDVLAAKEKEAADLAKQALIMSLVGIVCLGLILGILAFMKGSNAIKIIDTYQVAQDKRGMAPAAKILGIVDIIGWVCIIIARFALG